MDNRIILAIRELRENSAFAFIGSIGKRAFPQIKAMQVLEHDSLKVHLFATYTGSDHVAEYRKNPKASVYYYAVVGGEFRGALFTGKMEICTDHSTKAILWRDGAGVYQPTNVSDDDYCVLKFTAETVNYYAGMDNATYRIEDM